MAPVFHLTAAALAVSIAAASDPATALTPSPPSCKPTPEVSTVAFGTALLVAASESGTRNALVSPLGVGTALEMIAPGAKRPVRSALRAMFEAPDAGPADEPYSGGAGTGGELYCQFAWMLHDALDDAVAVQTAHAAFADRSLDLFPAYASGLRDGFGARVERVDFKDSGAADRINAWVEETTGGAIPRLVSRLDPDDVLVLANAIHFEGEWAQPFDPQRTVPAPFQLRAGPALQIPTMHAEDLRVRYREDESFQAAALAYGSGRFELVVVLPHAGLEATEALRRLAADPSWLGGKDFRRARGALAMPRLVLDAEASLLPALSALGLGAALDDPQAFAGIAAPAPKLSRVLHRTTLALDERGTEASAATAAIMATRAAPAEEEASFEMRVDRPFALAVLHRGTGAVLFTAWVDDPTDGER